MIGAEARASCLERSQMCGYQLAGNSCALLQGANQIGATRLKAPQRAQGQLSRERYPPRVPECEFGRHRHVHMHPLTVQLARSGTHGIASYRASPSNTVCTLEELVSRNNRTSAHAPELR